MGEKEQLSIALLPWTDWADSQSSCCAIFFSPGACKGRPVATPRKSVRPLPNNKCKQKEKAKPHPPYANTKLLLQNQNGVV